jgi:hypothetical protein
MLQMTYIFCYTLLARFSLTSCERETCILWIKTCFLCCRINRKNMTWGWRLFNKNKNKRAFTAILDADCEKQRCGFQISNESNGNLVDFIWVCCEWQAGSWDLLLEIWEFWWILIDFCWFSKFLERFSTLEWGFHRFLGNNDAGKDACAFT